MVCFNVFLQKKKEPEIYYFKLLNVFKIKAYYNAEMFAQTVT
jgi:hypothetical protein